MGPADGPVKNGFPGMDEKTGGTPVCALMSGLP